MNFDEISIPVPWGHISGKTYGNPDGQKVLVVHGWTDNAGIFDLLAPLLSESFYLVCIELPGHGLSSHFPVGIPYHQIEYVTTIRRIVRNYLKWTKFDYIGHSLGGAFGSMYAAIFPKDIDRLVMIDYVKTVTWATEESRNNYGSYCREFLALDKQRGTSAKILPHALAKLREMFVDVTDKNFNNQEAEILLKRGARCLQPGADQWTFTRDNAIRNMGTFQFSHETSLSILANMRCKLLLLKATLNLRWEEAQDLCESTMDTYKTNCESYEYIEVPGNHYVPLTNPTAIASHINRFLLARGAKT